MATISRDSKLILQQPDILGGDAARAVGNHNPVGVDDIQIRLPVKNGVGDRLRQVVAVHELPVPDQPHEIFHRGGHLGAAVVLENRHVDKDVGVEDRLVDFGFFHAQRRRAVHFAVMRFQMSRQHLAAGIGDGFLNAAVFITTAPFVTGVVEHFHPGSTGGQRLPDDFSDQFRIGVGRLLRGAVPADIRLDDDALARLDEGSHAAQRFNAAPEHCDRLAVADGHQIGFSGRFRFGGNQFAARQFGGDGGEGGSGGGGFQKFTSVHGFTPRRLFC